MKFFVVFGLVVLAYVSGVFTAVAAALLPWLDAIVKNLDALSKILG